MDDRTFEQKVSDAVTHFVGSWKFIFLAVVFFSGWIAFNTITSLNDWQWDKFPFILMNLVLSFIAAFQAPFIMMSQNRAERKQDEAYRMFFQEIKDLIQADMETESRIEKMELEIAQELAIVRKQQAALLEKLHQAIMLEKITQAELGEIIRHYEEEEDEESTH